MPDILEESSEDFMHNQHESIDNKKLRAIRDYYDNNWLYIKDQNNLAGWGYHKLRIHNIILDFLKIVDNEGYILEIGCGKGDLTAQLIKFYINIFSGDISINGVKRTKISLKENPFCDLLLLDALNLPFANGSFDAVILSEVIEHLLDKKRCIEEIFRVLKPGGFLILTTPNSGGFHRAMIRLINGFLRIPFKYSSQMIDEPLSPKELEKLLKPYYEIQRKRGLIYTIPHLERFNRLIFIKLSNQISELIENRGLISNYGLYQCILAKKI